MGRENRRRSVAPRRRRRRLACRRAARPPRRRPISPSLQGAQDLSQLSIEELAQLPVRSASKREEPLSAAPTALYVITGEDIAVRAATSLPEALRLAPNLHVQQVNARDYAITARGFNGYETSNKLLVLIDGRSVYTTLHSGVFWELHQPLLEDIEQIEVISGPGGTLYGPNAVNGVINIATRDARETLGGLVRGTLGTQRADARRRATASRSASSGAIRFYGNFFDRDGLPRRPSGPTSTTASAAGRPASAPISAFGAEHFTLQGDLFDNEVDDPGRRRRPRPQPPRALAPRARRAIRRSTSRPITIISSAASCSSPTPWRPSISTPSTTAASARTTSSSAAASARRATSSSTMLNVFALDPRQPAAVDPQRLRAGPDRADARAFADRRG